MTSCHEQLPLQPSPVVKDTMSDTQNTLPASSRAAESLPGVCFTTLSLRAEAVNP
ncbi:Uncharacterised protein [Rhodococcus coprophilus]|uniref:Uncharacterized protein n=1 Tax=Rhodococcus coprophilus TaxID=38310 RepID=A0A2X4UGY6_9NOCA|nr:Uncharacterised protein [Rhodococcus coprophilus]